MDIETIVFSFYFEVFNFGDFEKMLEFTAFLLAAVGGLAVSTAARGR